jgi:hypothetical protein
MTHLVHDMVGNVTVEGPIPGIVGNEVNGARLPDRNQERGLGPAGAFRDDAAVSLHHPEGMAVKMHRVAVHSREIDKADAHALTALGNHGLVPGKARALRVSRLKPANTRGSGR